MSDGEPTANERWDLGDVTIRPERPEDGRAIAGLVATAFESEPHARLVEAIRESPNFVPEWSLVAELEDRVVGHVMVSFMCLRDGTLERSVAVLSPLAVSPQFQNRGIGGLLVSEVSARVDARGEPLILLEGSPEFYGRLGFEHSVPHGVEIELPAWAPAEAAQIRRLESYDASIRGVLVYPPAFDVMA